MKSMRLVDEIDATLHVSALDKLFWLVRTCWTLNVQWFATTHSVEAIAAITEAARREAPVELVAFRLFAQGADVQPKRYSSRMLKNVGYEGGLDIR